MIIRRKRIRTGPLAIPTFDFSIYVLALWIFTTEGEKIVTDFRCGAMI